MTIANPPRITPQTPLANASVYTPGSIGWPFWLILQLWLVQWNLSKMSSPTFFPAAVRMAH